MQNLFGEEVLSIKNADDHIGSSTSSQKQNHANSYQPLAERLRPQTLDEIVGQDRRI